MKLLTSVSAAALVAAVERHDAILDAAVGADEHRERARVAQRHEVQLLEPQLALRRQHDARRLAEAGQRRRRRRKRILDRLVAGDLPLDLAPLARVRRRRLHDPVDEQAQPAFGRDSARRGMRMGEQPALLQLLHHAADRGRRQADASGQRLGADRQPALEIGFDHEAEDLAHAVGQFADRLGHDIHLGLAALPV